MEWLLTACFQGPRMVRVKDYKMSTEGLKYLNCVEEIVRLQILSVSKT